MPIIDHVGIAVKSLEEAIRVYETLLGQPVAGVDTVAVEQVRVAFFGHGAGRVELLEPTAADSPVGRFLARNGPGLHHICLAVPDLDEALRCAAESGIEPIPPGIRVGAEGRRVAFFHPRDAAGTLLELAETTDR